MKMHNDPYSWTHIQEILHAWWRGESPTGAVIIACLMAFLRIACAGGGWKRLLLEGPLCGLLTLVCVSLLEYLNWPKSVSIAIGGGIGFVGVGVFRAFLLNFIGKRFGADK